MNPLLKLKEAIEGAQRNASKMLNTLEGIDARLKELDTKTLPIRNSTAKLSNAKRNINLLLVEVEKNL